MEETTTRTETMQPETSRSRKVADWIANILSWVLVPTLVPVYAILLILCLSPLSLVTTVGMRLYVTLVVFAITCILPAILFIILKVFGIISDIGLNRRRERSLPYCIVIASYLLTAWYLYYLSAPDWVVMFYTGGAVAALINLVVNFKWKISAHSAAMGGVCVVMFKIAAIMPDTRTVVWLCVWLLLTGLLGSSRVWLRRHTMLQVLAGCAVGAASVYFMTLIHY